MRVRPDGDAARAIRGRSGNGHRLYPLRLADGCGARQPTAPVFCCGACATAHALISAHGLGAYHRFPERRGTAVRPSGRAFSDFDHEAFQSRYVTMDSDGLAHVELALEGVHCASCVWLIERVPLLVTGVARAELDVRQNRASVTWDPHATSLSEIAKTLDALGYTPHPYRGGERAAMRRRDDRAMLIRIGIAGAIATNAMLAAIAIYSGEFNTMDAGSLTLFRWVSLALTIPTLVWPGRVFFTSAWAALRARTVHMDVPIAFALAAATTRGAINTVTGTGPIYFDGVCVLVFLLLVGRFLQARGQRAATDATEQLFALTPATARLLHVDGTTRDVPADAVPVGAMISVRAGETIPADGEVVDGASRLNRAILTGESADVRVDVGDTVYAGTLNRTSELRISQRPQATIADWPGFWRRSTRVRVAALRSCCWPTDWRRGSYWWSCRWRLRPSSSGCVATRPPRGTTPSRC